MTATYWEVGRRIVEFEQGGEQRAEYGKEFLKRLASRSQLGVKVENSHLGETITNSAKLLPLEVKQINNK